ncbi:MAG: hypothetical protein R8G01_13745 [Ilumatobacteraceae bacterium]|nr:hypothetical protein [Ilumatobacteraceae bacterium]
MTVLVERVRLLGDAPVLVRGVEADTSRALERLRVELGGEWGGVS